MIVLGCGFPFINDNRQESRKSVVITIDLNHRSEFFDQLHKFADANGFSIFIDTMPSGSNDFLIDMKKKDVHVSGVSLSNEYQIAFFDMTDQPPVPDSVVDDLVSDLERYVSEVPGATFFTNK